MTCRAGCPTPDLHDEFSTSEPFTISWTLGIGAEFYWCGRWFAFAAGASPSAAARGDGRAQSPPPR